MIQLPGDDSMLVSVYQDAHRPHLVSVKEKSSVCPMKVSAQTTLCRSQMGSVWLILVQAGKFQLK